MTFRALLPSLALAASVLWFASALTGIAAGQIKGWYGFQQVLFQLVVTSALLVITFHRRTAGATRAPKEEPRKPENKLLLNALALYVTFLSVGVLLAFQSDGTPVERFGQIGDSLNVLTCLFVVFGFWGTIRQIHSEHEASASEEARHRDSIKAQERIAEIQNTQLMKDYWDGQAAVGQRARDHLAEIGLAFERVIPNPFYFKTNTQYDLGRRLQIKSDIFRMRQLLAHHMKSEDVDEHANIIASLLGELGIMAKYSPAQEHAVAAWERIRANQDRYRHKIAVLTALTFSCDTYVSRQLSKLIGGREIRGSNARL